MARVFLRYFEFIDCQKGIFLHLLDVHHGTGRKELERVTRCKHLEREAALTGKLFSAKPTTLHFPSTTFDLPDG
jgi:hypothetical protein